MNDKERMDLLCSALRDILNDVDRAESRLEGHLTEYLLDVRSYHQEVRLCLKSIIDLLDFDE